MSYTFRPYHSDDPEHLSNFLDRNMEFDSMTTELLCEKLEQDPSWDPELALLCLDQDNIIGFMQGVLREIKVTQYGFIKLMAVEQAYRRQGIARRLFEILQEKFRKKAVRVLRIYDAPQNYFMPGIDPRYTPALCFAQRLGFQRFGDTSNLVVDLKFSSWDTAQREENLMRDGIEIRRASHEEKRAVLEFVCTEWPLWEHEVEQAFVDDPPSIHVAATSSGIQAFAAHNGNNKRTGWFGPMGTDPGLRGKGVGGILLKRCMRDMAIAGLSHSIIPWVGPIDFYAHHAGACVERVFWRYEKKL